MKEQVETSAKITLLIASKRRLLGKQFSFTKTTDSIQ